MSERCAWCGTDPLYVAYHDTEWGVPNHDDRHLFEMLVLEGAQAGLSWITILRKREHYRRAFDGFDAERVARYGEAELARLLADAGIVRNRLKIESAVANACATLAAQERFGSLDALLWRFAEESAPTAPPRSLAEIPAQTAASQAMSRELKRLGFRFVGPTVCYAFMQAVGMVNDHVEGCFRQREIAAQRCATSPPPRP